MAERLCVAVLLACGMAVGQAQVAAKQIEPPKAPVFDAVSIKPSAPGENGGFGFLPGEVSAKSQPIYTMIMMAYFPFNRMFGESKTPLEGVPDWVMKERYDIIAKFDEATVQSLKDLKTEDRLRIVKPMLQAMLADRCKLVAHISMEDAPVYELVIGKHGEQMKETAADEVPPDHAIQLNDGAMMVPIQRGAGAKQEVVYFRVSMEDLAAELSTFEDRQVVDHTGLKGRYDLTVERVRRSLEDTAGGSQAADPGPMFTWDISSAGLELRPAKAPQPMLVIDHIERPSPN